MELILALLLNLTHTQADPSRLPALRAARRPKRTLPHLHRYTASPSPLRVPCARALP